MRIESLRVYEANDPEIGAGGLRYYPFHHTQKLGIFRTCYAITGTALHCSKVDIKMRAKLEAYQRHVMEIERFLGSGKGGEFTKTVEIEIPCECECGDEHTRTISEEMPFRLPYSYAEMIEAGLGINEEVILIGLKGRTLKHIETTSYCDEDMKQWEWLSEVALGVAKNHSRSTLSWQGNPFKLGWRDA